MGSRERGLRSATLHEIKTKVYKQLELKSQKVEAEILSHHKLAKERFEYSLRFYTEGTTTLLESEGYYPDPKLINK